MEITLPPTRDVQLPVIPFSLGAVAYADGFPANVNPYPLGTVAHDRFAAGWSAAASVADGELADITREAYEDAHEAFVAAREGRDWLTCA